MWLACVSDTMEHIKNCLQFIHTVTVADVCPKTLHTVKEGSHPGYIPYGGNNSFLAIYNIFCIFYHFGKLIIIRFSINFLKMNSESRVSVLMVKAGSGKRKGNIMFFGCRALRKLNKVQSVTEQNSL